MYRDADITFLSSLQESLRLNPDATQREISARQGISLGMTNAWLGKLADKGWILMHKVNRRTVRYALTAEGMRQIAVSTASYMKNTFSLMRDYSGTVLEKVYWLKERGCSKIVLVGSTNIDFLVEYACRKNCMEFEKMTATENAFTEGAFYIAGEDVPADGMTSIFDFVDKNIL